MRTHKYDPLEKIRVSKDHPRSHPRSYGIGPDRNGQPRQAQEPPAEVSSVRRGARVDRRMEEIMRAIAAQPGVRGGGRMTAVKYDPPKKVISKVRVLEAEVAKDLSELEGLL